MDTVTEMAARIPTKDLNLILAKGLALQAIPLNERANTGLIPLLSTALKEESITDLLETYLFHVMLGYYDTHPYAATLRTKFYLEGVYGQWRDVLLSHLTDTLQEHLRLRMLSHSITLLTQLEATPPHTRLKSSGLCSYLLDNEISVDFLISTIYPIFKSWQHYSGDERYPVPCAKDTFWFSPEDSFRSCTDMWIGTYGALREDLLKHTITMLQKGGACVLYYR